MKKAAALLLLVGIISGLFAQNEASKPFIEGTSLFIQKGSSYDKFPKLEIGFVGRKNKLEEAGAYIFIRFKSALETAGGLINEIRFKSPIECSETEAFDQFFFLCMFVKIGDERSKKSGQMFDMELGEMELTDFQWYILDNQWRNTYDKTCVVNLKIVTVGKETRLYFYRTAPLRDFKNNFETFNMPPDTYLTAAQCSKFVDAYGSEGSYVWKAIDIAIDAANRTIR